MTEIATAAAASRAAPGLEIRGAMAAGYDTILTPAAVAFVAELARRFGPQVKALLARREQRQAALDAGALPDFLPETRAIRESDWTIAGIPADLLDRRVEITGPTERKMIINALNSGADVFMADCEDSLCPSWANLISGQINLRDAVRRTIEFTSPEGKSYRPNERTAVLMVRPRGWHLEEKHCLLDDAPIASAFVDFGLYLFHNHAELTRRGTGPYFYLPKLESHLEARLWNDVFAFAEQRLGIRHGTIKCTVLIETILAAFEMHEILHELKDYIVGLNCGRWDYIFSFIKKFSHDPAFVLPDRYQVTMTTHFLRSYSLLVIRTCHRRRAFAMGGMAAQIPIKNDPAANEQALAKVRADKEREAGDGHDGTWVAHPGLVPIAKQVFDRLMPGPNNLARLREDVVVTAADLLTVPDGTITEAGLRNNIAVGIQYLAAWLGGNGCVPIYNLMEDAATAEISRAQVWQWLHHRRALADGRPVTLPLVAAIVREELGKLRAEVGDSAYAAGHFERAAELFSGLTASERFASFLTLTAYRDID
ncbi:MAG TPA: malate synthase A [Steroidobacteraceae bacterium]|nr:malate synthase A [Steroidobacteraceae bacterium]